jgi:hypothetical protein
MPKSMTPTALREHGAGAVIEVAGLGTQHLAGSFRNIRNSPQMCNLRWPPGGP